MRVIYAPRRDFKRLTANTNLVTTNLRGGEFNSPLGLVIYRSIDGMLCGLGFVDNFKDGAAKGCKLPFIFRQSYTADESVKGEYLKSVVLKLISEFDSPTVDSSNGYSNELSLCLFGTDFQHQVWLELLATTRGQILSYQQLSQRINGNVNDSTKNSTRAVANAVAANPVSLLVPCHRVLPKKGGVGNYLWGSAIKQQILGREGSPLTLT